MDGPRVPVHERSQCVCDKHVTCGAAGRAVRSVANPSPVHSIGKKQVVPHSGAWQRQLLAPAACAGCAGM
eukprot:2576111-Alexandrium_andersonii.AAC.1